MELLARRILINFQREVTTKRYIMSSNSLRDKALENLEKNPYYEKYSQKIVKVQQTSPEEFMKRIEDREKCREKREVSDQRKFTSLLEAKKPLSNDVEPTNIKPLCKIMRVDLIQEKTADEIREIWGQYHLQKDVQSACIHAKDYDAMLGNALKYPTFLFPLPRTQGYEFIMSQFLGNIVHFTPLICYQVHKENAPECLTLIHYVDLKDSKQVVLMRGEFDKDVINAQEAQCLTNQLQMYYLQNEREKLKLLETFTNMPQEFKHADLVKQIETLSLDK